MENKIKRFLSLLLALVMVIGMMPMGHAHAEVAVDGNTITMNVDDTHSFDVDGDYSALAGENVTVKIEANFVNATMKVASTTLATEIVDGDQYVIKTTRSCSAGPYVSATVAGKGLKFVNSHSESTYWTFNKVSDGVYKVSNASVSGDANKMSINGKNSVTLAADATVKVWYDTTNSCWKIYTGENNCLNAFVNENPPVASCWDSYDDGSRWELYHVDNVPAFTSSDTAVTELAAGKSYAIGNSGGTTNKHLLRSVASGNFLVVNNAMNPTNFDSTAIWTLGEDSDESSAFVGKIQAANGQYLSFTSGRSELVDADAAPDVTILENYTGKSDDTWRVACNGYYMNPQGGLAKTYGGPDIGHHSDDGNHWRFYEVVPVGKTTIKITALAVGQTTLQVGDTVYNIVVTDETVEPEVPVIDPFDKENWKKVSVDSETVYDSNEGLFEYAFDGNPNTYWHSNWQGAEDKLTGENSFAGVIDFGAVCTINRFSFKARPASTNSGRVTQASLYVKANEADEWKPVAEHAEFAANANEQYFCFEAQEVRYVKFVAERSNDGWVAVSEFNIYNSDNHTVTKTETAPTCVDAGFFTYTCSCSSIFYAASGKAATGNHTPTVVGAVKPTLCENGYTGNTVCSVCEAPLSESEEITQLPVATVLNGNKLVALSDCEYTLGGPEADPDGTIPNGRYSLVHTTTDNVKYYVNPAAPEGHPSNIPQSTIVYETLYLHWQDVAAGQGNAVHISGYGGMHFWDNQGSDNKNKNYWDRCGTGFGGGADNTGDRGHDLYLFRATGVGTGDVIPGYTKVTASDVKVGESYLIAGVCDGKWYVMHPSSSTTEKLDHVAEVKSELHTIGHKAGNPVEENRTDASYDLVTRCVYCNEVMDRETVYTQIVVKSLDVALEAEIQLKYTVFIPDAVVEAGAYVVLTKDGGYGTVTKTFENSALAKNSNGFYEFGIGIASGEMTCPVTIEVFDAEGNALNLYNKTRELGTSVTKTVEDYVELVLNNEKNTEEKKALAKALLVYGDYARINFGVEVPQLNFAELGFEPNLSSVDVAALESYKNSQTSDAPVRATGITAFLDSYIFVRVYMNVEGDISSYKFTLTTPTGTVVLTPVQDGNRYYVDIPEIASGYIDNTYTITVTNTSDEKVNEITTSVLSYARSVLNNEKNTEEKMNLAKALYLYNQAADAFFVQNNNANS